MSNDEVTNQMETLKEPMALGEIFAKSGLFPDIKTQAQAAVKILAGRELGLSPFEAMSGIYFVNNRMALTSNIMASLIKKGKKYDYSVKKLDDQECTIVVTKGDVEIGVSTFTVKDAAKAGLINKDNWKNYPRNMMFARALSNAVRWFAPDSVSGYYLIEEIEDIEPIKTTTVIELTPEGTVTNGKT